MIVETVKQVKSISFPATREDGEKVECVTAENVYEILKEIELATSFMPDGYKIAADTLSERVALMVSGLRAKLLRSA